MDVRNDFPILSGDKSLVYFDNACMTLRPNQVIEAITDYYANLSACSGRSNHHLANKVHQAVENSREKIRKFIGAKHKEEIVFTRNTTEGINLVANSLNLSPGDVVVISDKEHNSNLVPWLRLKDKIQIELVVVASTEDNQTDVEAWEKALVNQSVKLVAFGHTSNLDGVTSKAKDIIHLAHKYGALTLVDAAQAVPHQPISVTDLDVDFMAFSAHKMCGPSGMGVIYGKLDLLDKLEPFLTGGDTVAQTTYKSYEMLKTPDKFEAGLQDYAGIMGFGAAVDYLTEVGMENIHKHELDLTQLLTKKLGEMDRVKIIGPKETELRGGITSFTVDGADHHQVALMLDQMGNVAVRSGQHCVHSWFNQHKIPGSVRASVYFYNTKEEVEKFGDTLTKILRII